MQIGTLLMLALAAAVPQRQGARPVQTTMRFAEMDRNRDGVITRAEWIGSQASFRVHDWNGDGILSGDEVRVSAPWPRNRGGGQDYPDWTDNGFRQMDRNGDGRISRLEWRYDLEDFYRLDRNGDASVSLREFELGDIDDDRGDSFDNLDLNRDNRIERSEWHGSLDTFRWLDRNGDGVLARSEMLGNTPADDRGRKNAPLGGVQPTPQPAAPAPPAAPAKVAEATVVIKGTDKWKDTGIDVRPGDMVQFRSAGTIQFSPFAEDQVDAGGRNGRTVGGAPVPRSPIGSLVARIGAVAAFFVGNTSEPMRMSNDGRLFLGINDDEVIDNKGEFRVTITVMRAR